MEIAIAIATVLHIILLGLMHFFEWGNNFTKYLVAMSKITFIYWWLDIREQKRKSVENQPIADT